MIKQKHAKGAKELKRMDLSLFLLCDASVRSEVCQRNEEEKLSHPSLP